VRLRIGHKLALALALARGSAPARRATAAQVAAILEPTTELAAEMAAIEAEEARESQSRAQATYGDASSRILLLSVAAVLVCLLIAMALVRNLVPRLRSYSSFAGRVADGQLGERLTPRGGDEVADLGRALDLMVGRREGSGPTRRPRPSWPTSCSSARARPRPTSCSSATWSGRWTAAG
jgi:methyl-accepting chemotaxis protein